MRRLTPWLLCVLSLWLGCQTAKDNAPTSGVRPAPPGEPYGRLSDWGIFSDLNDYTPSEGVMFYQVNSPLYSDYAYKRRFMWIPQGKTIAYQEEGPWGFPVGSILVKTFGYLLDRRDPTRGETKLEVRLLVHEAEGVWAPHTYVWNAEQSRATRKVAGEIIEANWIHDDGSQRSNRYIVPNNNECEDCHGKRSDLALAPLSSRSAQLDRDGQLAALVQRGWLSEVPAPVAEPLVDPFGKAEITARVRSYLDSNCGHCHRPDGYASESALKLDWKSTDPKTQPETHWGVCKQPTSAGGATCGKTYDIVPGKPAESIFLCRLESTEPQVRMPPLVSRLPHEEGIQLLREWIEQMPAVDCSAP